MPRENDLISEFESPTSMDLLGGMEGDSDPTGQVDGNDNGGSAEQTDKSDKDAAGQDDTAKTPETGGKADNEGQHDGDQDAADTDQKGGRDQRIPRERFDELHRKFKDEEAQRIALEQRLSDIESKLKGGDVAGGKVAAEGSAENGGETGASQGKVDLMAMEREFYNAMMDGDEDKAIELRSKINAEIARQAREDASRDFEEKQTAKEREQAEREAQQALDTAAERVMERYPVLNLEKGGSKEMVDKVVKWRNFLIQTEGLPAHKALEQAADEVLGDRAPQQGEDTKVDEAKPAMDSRKEQAVKRGLKDAASQPPSIDGGVGGRGSGSPLPDSQDAWDKTPEKERIRHLM